MTHEYVIALGGIVLTSGPAADSPPTALAWAADAVLAVGSDEDVRAISRGDSTFLRLDGSAVTRAPDDPVAAETLLRRAIREGRSFRASEILAEAGLTGASRGLEPGSPADLAFWSANPETLSAAEASSLHLVALVRGGGFTTGDAHVGPFRRTA